MPKVGNVHYPYTSKGKQQAKAAAAKQNKPVQNSQQRLASAMERNKGYGNSRRS